MSKPHRVEIPEGARESLRMLFAQKQQIESNIQLYVRALQDTLDVKGEGWSLDIVEMEFSKQSPNGKVDADVVGTVASNSTD